MCHADLWRRLAALLVIVGIVLSPLCATGATVPTLVAYDGVLGATRMTLLVRHDALGCEVEPPGISAYDAAPFADDDPSNSRVAGGAGVACASDMDPRTAHRRKVRGDGALYDAPAAAPAAEGPSAGAGDFEVVQRAMSGAELEATSATGLLRGGRAGVHFVSDAMNSSATRAQFRLALPNTPEVRVTLGMSRGVFSSPSVVQPFELPGGGILPGGGLERTATGAIPVTILQVEFDKAGDLRKIVYPDGAAEHRWYDRQSRLVKVRDRAERVTRVAYDWESRVRRVDEAGVERAAEYSPEGDILRYRDGVRDVRFGYAGYHKLASKDEGGDTVRYVYSSEDDLVAIENEASERATFARDACGRVRTESGFDGRQRIYTRDALGRTTEVIKPDKAVQRFVYDATGNVTRIAYADGSEETFTYSVVGQLESATNAVGTVRFQRDCAGRLIREEWWDDWVEQQVDALGARIGVGTSRGLSQRIERTTEGFARSIAARTTSTCETWQASFERDALGHEMERRLPGGVRSRWTRDEYGRPLKHAVSAKDVAISNVEYRWRGASTIESMVSSLGGESLLEHDARGRLSAVHRSKGATEYRRPDRAGNVYRSADRKDRRYGRGGVLLEDRGTRMAYDADGNLAERVAPDGATWRYEWDAAGRMRAAVRPDEKRVEFEYDALSRRVAKRFDGKTVHWLWDGNNPVHEWSNDAAVTTWLFEPGSFAPMAKLGADGRRGAIVCDQVGAPELLVDNAGKAVWQGRLNAAGEAEAHIGDSAECAWRFPGQYEDAETGLFYNRFRYYDPRSDGYVSQDPIRFVGGRELYGYVPDPTTWIDPLGLAGCQRNEAAEEPSTALSTIRQSAAGERFFHYGYAEQAARFEGGIRPGGYATTVSGLSGDAAQAGLALPHATPPNAMYTVTPQPGTWVGVNPRPRRCSASLAGYPRFSSFTERHLEASLPPLHFRGDPVNNCPFKVGDFVIYRPSAIGRDKSAMTDLADLQPGVRYKIARIDKDAYVVLDGHEAGPAGGLYWTEFKHAS